MELKIADEKDIDAYLLHLDRSNKESLTDPIISSPAEGMGSRSNQKKEKYLLNWKKSVTEPGWKRTFIAKPEDNLVVGEITVFNDPPLRSSLHRVTLAMGVERNYRSKGLGTKLLETCIGWLRTNTNVEWVDLYVFANNKPARKLYENFGFKEVGCTEDRFRVRGESITDIEMVFKI